MAKPVWTAERTWRALVKSLLPVRSRLAHKGDFGKVLLLCGSKGLAGAAMLAARAALRTGSGIVYLGVPEAIYSICAGACASAVASVAAYGFTRWRGKIRDTIFFAYVILMLMPYQVTLVPNYLVSDYLGLLNTRWAIILPGAFAPFSVFLLTKSMRRIPASLIESAKLDGAGEWHIFWNICLPQCRSALYSIAILVFIDYWNMVEQPLILLPDASQQPLSVYLSQINAGEIGIAFAAAVIYMVPGLLMFLHGEAYLVEGITYAGSVKG